ncbi:MAG: GtrA family protein [Clostridia bacterium]|nr:GtrA family protein [Clostridia bacterium]
MNKIKELIVKNKELISYIFWGGMTTVVSYLVLIPCVEIFKLDETLSNIISWIISVAFAYIVNKIFVFKSNSWEAKVVFREAWQFVSARLVSLLIADILIFKLLVDVFDFNYIWVKLFTNVLVVIMNYVFSKLVIFKKK